MTNAYNGFEIVTEFHGHVCPGLALGYRVSLAALREFEGRATDEELVAVVENNSCAVDAVQVMTGCTFGKGNLVFKDFGKQVYTFFRRPSSGGLRISVRWISPPETGKEKEMWERYMSGDQSEEVLKVVHDRKARKIASIMDAGNSELFDIKKVDGQLPGRASIYPSVVCSGCGEKVMEPRARIKDGRIVCIPCMEDNV
ncbi:FmdE, Molybdenum formylmethanofuran dehydrogenase operon [bacterium BMS3Abin07]|nr:FmdE, Molybdenum formylmethanofuran dehydrogenase operon [bacterium BMS3Abin07]GBE31543.1 FmdE, Molybdenum formylmethanofuran dehydrogenase operon [bacterium BMS3Bbin05]HDL19957.1 formylmethanofuran dehydrogenase [Nitrospirota bacterium]HDO22029.1 formylmethanofuran dehydrogenase [Nitrospirota bacterium]